MAQERNTDLLLQIQLFYITADNTLSFAAWVSIYGWRSGSLQFDRVYNGKKVDPSAVSSRQLSIAIMKSPSHVYLFYENSNGNFTVLRTSDAEVAYYLTKFIWVDVTNTILDQLGNTSYVEWSPNFGAPVSFSILNDKYHNDVLIIFLAVESKEKSVNAFCQSYCWGLHQCNELVLPSLDPTHDLLVEIRELDVKLVTIGDSVATQSGPTIRFKLYHIPLGFLQKQPGSSISVQ